MAIPLLEAEGPHHDHAEELMLYGRLVGSWEIDARNLTEGGWKQSRGEWHFGWGLAGLAVVDVIHSPRRGEITSGQPLAEMGTTIRVYDPPNGTWQITFVSAVRRRVERLVGRRAGDDIHQDGTSADGQPIRWNFTDITPDSFTWRGYVSPDEGHTWSLNEEMLLRRAPVVRG